MEQIVHVNCFNEQLKRTKNTERKNNNFNQIKNHHIEFIVFKLFYTSKYKQLNILNTATKQRCVVFVGFYCKMRLHSRQRPSVRSQIEIMFSF